MSKIACVLIGKQNSSKNPVSRVKNSLWGRKAVHFAVFEQGKHASLQVSDRAHCPRQHLEIRTLPCDSG
jgi:hypothetical protein